MSLTSDLKNKQSFIRTFIDAHFSNLPEISRECNRALRPLGTAENPHGHKVVSMLVGTAIDYRIRGYFRRAIHHSDMVRQGILNLQRIDACQITVTGKTGRPKLKWVDNPWYADRNRSVGERLTASFERFGSRITLRRRLGPQDEERMCRYCILFAYLDWIGRAPFGNSATERMILLGLSTVTQMLRGVDAAIVADVARLSGLFIERQLALIKDARKVVIGRALEGSADVFGGADFDLIIDGCLLDFKTSLKARVTTDILRQLVGYWLLDYSDKYRIETVGIVLMRHGHILKFNVRDLLSPAISPSALRALFRTGLQRETSKRRTRYELSLERDRPAER
jgi:hypothetical protein